MGNLSDWTSFPQARQWLLLQQAVGTSHLGLETGFPDTADQRWEPHTRSWETPRLDQEDMVLGAGLCQRADLHDRAQVPVVQAWKDEVRSVPPGRLRNYEKSLAETVARWPARETGFHGSLFWGLNTQRAKLASTRRAKAEEWALNGFVSFEARDWYLIASCVSLS